MLGRPGIAAERPSFTFARLINDAVAKKPPHPLVIFLDTKLPYKWSERWLTPQAGNTLSRPMQILLDEIRREYNDVNPYNLLILSNHPHHYAIQDLDPSPHLVGVPSKQPKAHMLALRNLAMAASLYGNIPMGFTMEGDPPPPAVPVVVPKGRYDLQVSETTVSVLREGKQIAQTFSTTDKDRSKAPSKLHEFLEDIGLSRVDAQMICAAIEEAKSVPGVFAPK